ncbi:putative signaling protein [Burkholderiaceae bacterium]|nr:putative signaling protein [Burkholderiaceae bacterium]
MTSLTETALPLDQLALPLRFAAGMVALWCGALLALVVAQRADARDTGLRRNWLLTAGAVTGACGWAGRLCLAMAIDSPPAVPLGGGILAWLLAVVAAGALLIGAFQPRRRHGIALTAVASLLLFIEIAVWSLVFGWSVPPAIWLVIAAAAIGTQFATWALLLRWQRRERSASWARTAAGALLLAAVQMPALAAAAWTLPIMDGSAPGSELLLALLAALMAGLALLTGRMQRQLVGRHQALGAQLQQATAHLKRTPLTDPLTGLLSRLGIEAALRQAAVQAEGQGQRVAVFAIGLDGFKSVNDSLGHALGDSVLREVARRLIDQAAAMLAPPRIAGHHLARLGSDEFVLALHGHVDRAALARSASTLLTLLDGPLVCEEHELRLSASIGIACFPEDGGASKLIARANAAMQAAKAAGGSTYMLFEPRMQDDARDKHELLRDLRQAIANQQLELFYQPKIDARSGQVTAAEALLRWHHPLRGTLSPEVFIPLAERHGLIGALGNWVIEDACRQAKVWRERGLKMRMAINLSVFQMRQNDLVERIQSALKRHGVNPSRLTCEITESVAMEDTQVTQRTFERLGQAGIHLSIDDFGTGYSSLSYLRRLPATELKIDRSFVMDLDSSADARAIVDAVLKLAHAIGLKVVAEGVETIRQRDILLELGCDEFQGYLFARPMSARGLLLWAVDDRPMKNAFRPSLFGETGAISLQGLGPAAPRS